MQRSTDCFFIVLFCILLSECNQQTKQNKTCYSTRTEVTWSDRFCTLYIDEDGRAQVIKGHYTDLYLMSLTITDTSKVFKLDSVKQFYKTLQVLASKHYIDATSADSPTFRIYRNGALLYCDYGIRAEFWDVFRPILVEIPNGYNPFIQEPGNPFGDI